MRTMICSERSCLPNVCHNPVKVRRVLDWRSKESINAGVWTCGTHGSDAVGRQVHDGSCGWWKKRHKFCFIPLSYQAKSAESKAFWEYCGLMWTLQKLQIHQETIYCILVADYYTAVQWQKEATLENEISRKWAKCVCHVHWHQCNIIIFWLKYLSSGWVFLLQTWNGSRMLNPIWKHHFLRFWWFVSCFLLSE